jgi:hypothetical protein
MKMKLAAAFAALSLVVTASAQSNVTVYANNPSGDAFTNAGGSGINQNVTSWTGLGGEVWRYSNVRDQGVVGISTNQPRSGDASARIQTPGTTGNARSDMNLIAGTSGSLGNLDSLSHWSLDARTDSSSFANQAPVIRMTVFSATDINLSNGSAGVFGEIALDTTWDPGNHPTFTFGQWNNIDLIGGNRFVRASGGSLRQYNPGYLGGTSYTGDTQTLSSLLGLLAGKGYIVTSVGAGFGGTSGQFDGAIDNYTLGFGGNFTTYNFEAVPEPMTMTVMVLGALAALRKKRKV